MSGTTANVAPDSDSCLLTSLLTATTAAEFDTRPLIESVSAAEATSDNALLTHPEMRSLLDKCHTSGKQLRFCAIKTESESI